MMLYQVLLDNPHGTALDDLEKVLDKVTPLYKHRMDSLPLQQRRIIDVIAKKWDAASAKEIAAEIRDYGKKLPTKLISAQLAQLERNNIIEKKGTTTKNHLYQLRERFFNIWYLMRNGDRRDRERVAWLAKFLEMWYEPYVQIKDTSNILKEEALSYHPDIGKGRSVILKAFVAIRNKDYSDPSIEGMFREGIDFMAEDNFAWFNDVLLLLLARHQYYFLLQQFDQIPRMKEQFKPIYYALVVLMEEEMPNAVIRMGDELKVPVEEVLEKVKQMKIDSAV